MPKYTLCGEVKKRWQKKGCPDWDYETTEKMCLAVNDWLAKRGQNLAPRFREEVRKKNKVYIKQWVKGCHFDWHNPRQSK